MDKALSILKASIASLIFLFILTSLVNKKFFATCCVIVDAPSNLFEEITFEIFLIIALITPFASTPGWEKKFLSSADKKDLITILGILSYGTKILFSDEKSLTSSPPPEYNLLETEGLYIFKNL